MKTFAILSLAIATALAHAPSLTELTNGLPACAASAMNASMQEQKCNVAHVDASAFDCLCNNYYDVTGGVFDKVPYSCAAGKTPERSVLAQPNTNRIRFRGRRWSTMWCMGCRRTISKRHQASCRGIGRQGWRFCAVGCRASSVLDGVKAEIVLSSLRSPVSTVASAVSSSSKLAAPPPTTAAAGGTLARVEAVSTPTAEPSSSAASSSCVLSFFHLVMIFCSVWYTF